MATMSLWCQWWQASLSANKRTSISYQPLTSSYTSKYDCSSSHIVNSHYLICFIAATYIYIYTYTPMQFQRIKKPTSYVAFKLCIENTCNWQQDNNSKPVETCYSTHLCLLQTFIRTVLCKHLYQTMHWIRLLSLRSYAMIGGKKWWRFIYSYNI